MLAEKELAVNPVIFQLSLSIDNDIYPIVSLNKIWETKEKTMEEIDSILQSHFKNFSERKDVFVTINNTTHSIVGDRQWVYKGINDYLETWFHNHKIKSLLINNEQPRNEFEKFSNN